MTSLDGGMPVPQWTAEKHLENMDRLNICFSLLTISSPHMHLGDPAEAAETARACNEYGAQLMKEYPDRISVGASLPLPEIDASIDEVRYCREVLGINSFSLMTNFLGVYIGDTRLDPVMEELNKQKTLLIIHPTEPSSIPQGVNEKLPYPFMEFFFDTTRAVTNLLMNGTVRRFPNLRFLVPHAGAFLPILSDRLIGASRTFPAFRDLNFADDLRSMYYDLAGVSMPKQYDVLRQMTTTDHLMYGSDGAFTPVGSIQAMAQMMENKLDDYVKPQIYYGNAKALLSECGIADL